VLSCWWNNRWKVLCFLFGHTLMSSVHIDVN
jgi:hypothetical protein